MKSIVFACSALVLLALTACGGGGGSSDNSNSTPPPENNPPTGRTTQTTAKGPISGFGSIIVNGQRYDTNSAVFMIDGNSGTQFDLAVGHVVLVKAKVDDQGNASATEVVYDDVVEGPIDSINATEQTMIVLGQTVRITANTFFDDNIQPDSLDGLAPGQIVEVSGQFDANTTIVASRIERKQQTEEYEVHGRVSNLDSTASRFSINQLKVDFSNAVLDNFGANGIRNNDLVEVKGIQFSTDNHLMATKVELDSPDSSTQSADSSGEIRGFITQFDSVSSFTVSEVEVTTTNNTQYLFGNSGDLRPNILIEVEGVFNANGVLVADKIKFEHEASIRMESTVEQIDESAKTITVFGNAWETDSSTSFEDDSDADLEMFAMGDLSIGDFVEIRGVSRGSGALYATRIERDDEEDEHVVKAPAVLLSGESIELAGVLVSTDGRTEYRDTNDMPMSRTAFFEKVSNGSLVKAKGRKIQSRELLAEELSLELEHD